MQQVHDEEYVKNQIVRRKNANELIKVVMYISVPQYEEDIEDNESIQKVIEIFKRNNVSLQLYDSVAGSYNLNKYWYQTSTMNAAVEFDGVYPEEINPKDWVTIHQLEYEGKLVILVYLIDSKGDYIPNM